jgi:tetratricopeptide (TPR) repeat protein
MGGDVFEDRVNRFDEALNKLSTKEFNDKYRNISFHNDDDKFIMLSYEVIKYAGRFELLQKLREADRALGEDSLLKNHVINSWLFRIAAVLLMIFLVSQYYSKYYKNTDSEYVFDQFFEPYVNIAFGTYRSAEEKAFYRDEGIRTLKRKAYHSYDKADYQQCILDFERIPEMKKTLADNFFAGNAYLALGDTASAIIIFKKLKEVDGVFKNQSLWYLGLAYLKSGEKSFAIEVFEELKNTESVYSDKAREILGYLIK